MKKESVVNLASEILRVCLDDRACYDDSAHDGPWIN